MTKHKKSTVLFHLEELLLCDGVLDHSFGGHNSLPMSYEDIAKFILDNLEKKGFIEFEPEQNESENSTIGNN
jgi:hypothetical protein